MACLGLICLERQKQLSDFRSWRDVEFFAVVLVKGPQIVIGGLGNLSKSLVKIAASQILPPYGTSPVCFHALLPCRFSQKFVFDQEIQRRTDSGSKILSR